MKVLTGLFLGIFLVAGALFCVGAVHEKYVVTDFAVTETAVIAQISEDFPVLDVEQDAISETREYMSDVEGTIDRVANAVANSSKEFADAVETAIAASYNGSADSYSQTIDASRVEDIKFVVAIADTYISTSPDEFIHIEYDSGGSAYSLGETLSGNTLTISERRVGWNFFDQHNTSTLVISIPEGMVFDEIQFNVASADLNVTGLRANTIKIENSSGDSHYQIHAEKLDLKNTSGDIIVTSIEKETNGQNAQIKQLKATVTSGSITVYGFTPSEYSLKTTSGDLSVHDLAGSGKIQSTSGNTYAEFDRWDGEMKIDSTYGDITVYVPQGSGMELDVDRTSGNVTYSLDGAVGQLNDGEYKIGGENKQPVKIDITSGDIYLSNAE